MNHFRVLVVLALLVLAGSSSASASHSPWALACDDGRVDAVVDDFETTAGTLFTAHGAIPQPGLRVVAGCNGNALAIDYDLTNIAPPGSPNAGQSWVVVQRQLPGARDFTPYSHIRLALRGSNLNSHDTVDVKLGDSAGRLFMVALPSLADLPVWRVISIDFRELSGPGVLDLANITSIEVAVRRCDGCETFDNPGLPGPPEQHTGTLFVDEFAVVNLKPGATHRVIQTSFEPVNPDPMRRMRAAQALLGQVTQSGAGAGLVPTWFPEAPPTYNLYAQAEALLVFVYEYEQSGNPVYRDAARALAARLLALQIAPGKTQAGAWFTSYTLVNGVLTPPNRKLPAGQPAPCDGDEVMVPDPSAGGALVATNIDTCQWVGNAGWVLIALGRLERSGFFDDPAALRDALDHGAAWVAGQPAFRGNTSYPGLISLGIEGNISAYFGLLAAGEREAARRLGDAIFQFGWDPVQRRMRPGVLPADFATALDVSGSWGVFFLRSIGKRQEALDSLGYTASVLRTTSFDGTVDGYGDIAGPYTVAVEFSAQAASAGIHGADQVLQHLYTLQAPAQPYTGAFPGATDHWSGGQLSPWSTTMRGVSPTAWVYFASLHDPLWDLTRADIFLPAVGR
jgi:hypothetical protein